MYIPLHTVRYLRCLAMRHRSTACVTPRRARSQRVSRSHHRLPSVPLRLALFATPQWLRNGPETSSHRPRRPIARENGGSPPFRPRPYADTAALRRRRTRSPPPSATRTAFLLTRPQTRSAWIPLGTCSCLWTARSRSTPRSGSRSCARTTFFSRMSRQQRVGGPRSSKARAARRNSPRGVWSRCP
jgi:hypothetical protein